MVSDQLSQLHRQINRVSRRLFVQVLLNCLAWSWAVALGITAVWFIAQPLLVRAGLFAEPAGWVRWAVGGGLLVLATVVAVVLTLRRSPSRLSAALSIDEKFSLKERVTTSFALTPEQLASPAGQALIADLNERIDRLDVRSRFPVRLHWNAAAVPALAAVIAIVAVFWNPERSKVDANTNNPNPQANNATEAKQREPRKAPEKRPADKPKSANVEKIDAELEKIARNKATTPEQAREQMKALTDLENKVQDQEKMLADKQQALQQQLKQLDQMASKDAQGGPAKDLKDALAKGDMAKAKDEMDRLAKKLKDNELTEKEQEQLKKQIDDIQEKVERLSKQQDKEDQLKKLHEEGKLDAETLEKELENLKKDSEKLQDLKDLANKLQECKNCMEDGDSQGAGDKLKEAGEQLKEIEANDQELKDLREQLQRTQEAKNNCNGQCNGEGNNPNNTDNASGRGRANGKRPEGKDSQYGSFDNKQRGDFDPKGQKIHDGYLPGQNFKKKSKGIELEGEINQAKQEAPEAIEQQRIPKAARDMAKGYFENLGGPKKEKKDKE